MSLRREMENRTWDCPGCGQVNQESSTDEELGHYPGYVWFCSHCEKGWEWIDGTSQEVTFED
jgi:hypothetical protein